MNVSKKHFVDKSEQDEDGYHEYYYAYDIYEFSKDKITYVARSYTEDPEEAHFLSLRNGRRERLLNETDVQTDFFKLAVEHLRGLGKLRIKYLSSVAGGYVDVPH